MKKIVFVKEHYVNDELHSIIVRYIDELGKATASYNPVCVPKYIKKFMEKHTKEIFSTVYDKEVFGIVEYIYR